MKLRKSAKQCLKIPEQEEDDDNNKDASSSVEIESKKKLAAILSKAPITFPWLFRSQFDKTKIAKMDQQNNQSITSTTSAFKLFEKDNTILKNKSASASESTTSTFSTTNTFQSKFQLIPARNQPISIQLKHQKTQQIESDDNKNFKDKTEQINLERIKTAEKENTKDKAENHTPDLSIPEKALTGGTLLQRATKLSVEDKANINMPINNCFPSTSSMLTLLEGTKLGMMTEAHREATVSEWRRRSEKELKRKIGINSNVRNILRSPRQEGEITDDDNSCSNQNDNASYDNKCVKKYEKKTIEENNEKGNNFNVMEEDMDISIEEEEFLDIDDDLAKQILANVDKEDKAEAKARKKAKKALKRSKREKKEKFAKRLKITSKDKSKSVNDVENHSKIEESNSSNEERPMEQFSTDKDDFIGSNIKQKEKERKKIHSKKRKREKDDKLEKHSKQKEKKIKSIEEKDEERAQNKSRNSRSKKKNITYSRSISSKRSFRRSKSRSRSRDYSRSHNYTGKHAGSSRRSRSRSASSRTYSSSPIRSRHRTRSRSFSPLPPFNRRRAFENRRRLIEESWHRRIEDSIRPYSRSRRHDISPIQGHLSRSAIRNEEKPFDKADYVDENGEIDRQKLLEIATRNATKLAMEGKLPKGAELVDTIKNKSVDQLIGLCKQLQAERDLFPKGSSSSDDEDEDRHYSKRYNDWKERHELSKDREFKNRGVRSAPSRKKVVEREMKEIRQREDSTLRLNFPVSSGVTHRKKANEVLPEIPVGPLVRFGEIGPLTTALSKVRTSIPAVYRPLSQPLSTAQPISSLSTHFQSTSAIQLGPYLPEKSPSPSPPPDIVNSHAYKIALAAAARTAAMEKEKVKVPELVTSNKFIGPIESKPTALDVIAAATALYMETKSLSNKNEQVNYGEINGKKTTSESIDSNPISTNSTNNAKTNVDTAPALAAAATLAVVQMKKQQMFSSSWDKPGHIVAREEFLRRIAEQKQKAAEESAVANAAEEKMAINLEDAVVIKSAPLDVQIPTVQKQQSSLPIAKETIQKKSDEGTIKEHQQVDGDLIDRMQAYVDAQVARQKSESILHATILSAQLHQRFLEPKDEMLSSIALNKTQSRDPIGLTENPKSIQELVAERLKYSQRLQKDPNDFESRKALAKVEQQMSKWAEDLTLPGEFTGHTGARVLSEKELEPNDPRFHAWAKKDQFRNAPEVCSGVGMRLLQKMGWKPGEGLGRDAAGPIEPLALDVKSDRKGFYSEDFERVPKRENVLDPTGKNPISVLMEVCCRHRWSHPDFYCEEMGTQNNRRYLWKAILNGVEYSPSLPSSNKKAGKAQVCMVILEALGLTSD